MDICTETDETEHFHWLCKEPIVGHPTTNGAPSHHFLPYPKEDHDD